MNKTHLPEAIDRKRSDLVYARGYVLSRLGLAGPLLPAAAMADHAKDLGMIQIDSIRVSGLRNHEIAWVARGMAPVADFYDLLYRDRALIETHYPLFAIRRDWLGWFQQDFKKLISQPSRLKGLRPMMSRLKRHIRDHGPVSPANFDSLRVPGGFNTIKATTKALEYLYCLGEIQIAGITAHFHRVFDLTERVLSGEPRQPRATRADLLGFCVQSAAGVLKLATEEQIARRAAHHLGTWRGGGLPVARKAVQQALEAGTLAESAFARSGKGQPYLVLRQDSTLPEPVLDDTVRLIPPLDNLLFSRQRLIDLFDTDYKFEAYTPRNQRRYYFALPILYRDRIVGMIDAKKDDDIWRIQGLEIGEHRIRDELRRAVHRLAGIAGARRVTCSRSLEKVWKQTLDGRLE